MHLLAAQPGGFVDADGIVDLQQDAGRIVILSTQDSSLGLLAEIAEQLPPDYPSLRLANVQHLLKPAAYDLYETAVLQHAQLIVVALLGGVRYWEYGTTQLAALAQRHSQQLLLLPGDDQPEPELWAASRCDRAHYQAVWRYLREGGHPNTRNLFRFIEHRILADDGADDNANATVAIDAPRATPATLLYAPGGESVTLAEWLAVRAAAPEPARPTALLLFYRAHVQAGNCTAFDQLLTILQARFHTLAVATLSLKNPECLATINHLLAAIDCDVIINTTAFSAHQQNAQPVFTREVPVIQAIMASNSANDWRAASQGLRARDLAMNVVLPEYDGRIISRAISFKKVVRRAAQTQVDIIRYQLDAERATFVMDLAWRWARLRHIANPHKRVALILANYPTQDGRIGNGVGLDTPASVVNILRAMAAQNYAITELPADGDALIARLQRGATNALHTLATRATPLRISVADYQHYFTQLPARCQEQVLARWGAVTTDPKYHDGHLIVAGLLFGEILIGIQPSRGYDVDIAANYHDPDLVPPHAYLAFYFYLRYVYGAHAIAHIGKHGNLEWLPGKSVGLSAECWPDAVLGPWPHLYPFIVNDPGEGSQAKRRAQAVILDHLTPPMARAESYGELADLEQLLDEYYLAQGLDTRREQYLAAKIVAKMQHSHIAQELPGVAETGAAAETGETSAPTTAVLQQLDTYLCELKEAQIRHGLHRYGELPKPHTLTETLVALTRLPRGRAAHEAGILHGLVRDLELRDEDGAWFEPLQLTPAAPWRGARPPVLVDVCADAWRTQADTRERLELFAEQCLTRQQAQQPIATVNLPQTEQLFTHIADTILPAIHHSARDEIANFLAALDGQFVPPGPSGAPTRGRLDVLPTGRNFYSVDARAIPTQSAWELGQRSAEQLLQRHVQEHGDYPKQLGLSVWGTATMRTGGDDIAQAFALMGVRPVWAEGSNRVIDIEVLPAFQLGRPRVDVTLRISGFFRDAFANVLRLFDCAVQALAEYAEPPASNPLRHHINVRAADLLAQGYDKTRAHQHARMRIFGPKPGGYGAGLQGLIAQGAWETRADLAKAYVNWGGYSYGGEQFGVAAFADFEARLGQLEAVVHNQDNREHDLLDSDDYYQFQGGMANAVAVLGGALPSIYHGDHSNPAAPKIRTLKEELNRVIRTRLTNPKWLAAMREHGYKGAFEMAASVDYLFAYDATTDLIADYQYETVTRALILDPDNRQFLETANVNALKELAERLLEAQQRGLWHDPGPYQQHLTDAILCADARLEGGG